jgi:hypothetical protein
MNGLIKCIAFFLLTMTNLGLANVMAAAEVENAASNATHLNPIFLSKFPLQMFVEFWCSFLLQFPVQWPAKFICKRRNSLPICRKNVPKHMETWRINKFGTPEGWQIQYCKNAFSTYSRKWE